MGVKVGNNTTKKDINRLKRFIDDIDHLNMSQLHASLGDTGVQIIEKRFDKFIDPDGKRWEPLKKDYVYRVGGKNSRIAKRDKNSPLKRDILYKSFLFDADSREVRIGTKVDYAKYHTDAPKNNGSARRKIPLREFMGFNDGKDQRQLLDTAMDFIDGHTERGV